MLKELYNLMTNEGSNPKEEVFAITHELSEWLDTLRETIEKTRHQDLTMTEAMALARVIKTMKKLDRDLTVLDLAISFD